MKLIEKITNLFSDITGVQFVFLTYTTKENNYRTAETSIYKLNLGASIENLYKSDLKALQALTKNKLLNSGLFTKFTWSEIKHAKQEIINSLNDSLLNGIGNNSNYRKQGYYEHLNKNVKYSMDENNEPQQLYINALSEDKQVLLPATVKRVKNSRNNTIIKQLLDRNYCKRSKFREFRIDIQQIKSLSVSGEKLLIDASI